MRCSLSIRFLYSKLTGYGLILRRMDENWSPELTQSLIDRYPELSSRGNIENFKRKWRYMFMYMEVGYAHQWVSMLIWTFVRPVSGRHIS